MTTYHTRERPDEAQDDEADSSASNLGEALTIRDRDDADEEKQLHRLHDVYGVACPATEYAESGVTEGPKRVAMGI